ncbi:MAG: response regulator [Candidatus Thiodiazotropha sp.]
MQRMRPHTHLSIGGFAVATVVLGLLILFLTSTPLDPVIQLITLTFYLVAVFAMGATLRSHFARHQDEIGDADSAGASKPDESSEVETETDKTPSALTTQTKSKRAGVILLTRHDDTAKQIHRTLSAWNLDLEVIGSCAEASQLILNRHQQDVEASKVTLIIDIRELEMDPIHLPCLIEAGAGQPSPTLICIADNLEAATAQHLLDSGYSAILNAPIDKSQLFSLLTDENQSDVTGPNVVNLAHYRKRSGQQDKKRILLADQHTADRKRIAAMLQKAGHRVKSVENGEQALDALERQRFDVALINLKLPIMNGTQVIKLHRFTTPHPHWVSFIVMTEETTPATLRLCRDLQIRACFFKPVPSGALLEMINTAPVIAHPIPATIASVSQRFEPQQRTRFLHADLLDIKVLQALDQLDTDSGFVPDLITIFKRDSVTILQGMEDAAEAMDTQRFTELSSILMDNAGQLGAFALYEMCLTLQQTSYRELNATIAAKLSHLSELLDRTNLAFQHFLTEREHQRTDRN